MRTLQLSILAAIGSLALVSCQGPDKSYISNVADVPLKSSALPSTSWEVSPLRSNAMYIMHDARTRAQRAGRVGDYYYVRWYDAEPDKPVRLVMRYTQARTGSTVLTSEYVLDAPRAKKGTQTHRFVFNGDVRKRMGDVLSWRIDLYVGGELRDSRQSYLWQEPAVTGGTVVPTTKVNDVLERALRSVPEAETADSAGTDAYSEMLEAPGVESLGL